MTTLTVLNEAIQIGPWRISRRILLFVVLFCVVFLAFGVLVLETHVFSSKIRYEDDDDDEDDDWDFGNGVSDGDWVMVSLMIIAGLLCLATVFACLWAKPNAPRSLTNGSRSSSVYSVRMEKSSIGGVPALRASYSAPQQLPLWQGVNGRDGVVGEQGQGLQSEVRSQVPQVTAVRVPSSQHPTVDAHHEPQVRIQQLTDATEINSVQHVQQSDPYLHETSSQQSATPLHVHLREHLREMTPNAQMNLSYVHPTAPSHLHNDPPPPYSP